MPDIKEKSIAKRISILVAVLLAALLFWGSVQRWLEHPDSALSAVSQWVWPLAFLVLLAATTALALLLFERFWFRMLAILLAGVPVFILGFDWLYGAGLAVMLLASSYAASRIQGEYRGRARMDLRGILGAGTRLIVTALLLLFAVGYYLSPTVQAARTAQKLPPTVTQLIQEVTRRFLSVEFSKLSLPQRTAAENRAIKQVTDQLNRLARPYVQFLPFIFTLGLFLLLEGLGFVFSWLAVTLALGIFILLKRSKFILLKKQDITAETITQL